MATCDSTVQCKAISGHFSERFGFKVSTDGTVSLIEHFAICFSTHTLQLLDF